jgi:hypothetical protein
MDFQGQPFSAVFSTSSKYEVNTWRIRNSGVKSRPWASDETRSVLEACQSLRIQVEEWGYGSPANASSYHVKATFLDGGVEGQTGDYWFGERGVWVRGRKAVLLLALELGLSVRPGWYRQHDLVGVTLEALKTDLLGSGPAGTSPE